MSVSPVALEDCENRLRLASVHRRSAALSQWSERTHNPADCQRLAAIQRPRGSQMSVSVDRHCSWRACILAALAVSFAASAQAPSNPTLNAQLLVGARQGDLAQVQRVLDAGASPASRNRLGKTALLLAAEKGNLAIVEAVLQKGADVNQASLEGVTPLMAAAYFGSG